MATRAYEEWIDGCSFLKGLGGEIGTDGEQKKGGGREQGVDEVDSRRA